ncbi:lipoyl(octanoyl) transferase [Mariprofundus ferrinatatus]|uniref:Octanoyltransferase n=1 Tax=Mariprofundus ferrinatatus TaxID=1921087 RepID=A0A2K8L1H3_9PROT|nr:lipoyl(octanoyl) transferase LipB [Mariprofundus ferrinatatus]ATX80932.1 lipoyl(octanoyl) transferase [Mariprofundus ferrinatatus]
MQIIHHDRQEYTDSVSEQEALVAAVLAGKAEPSLILTEHAPVYTIGTSGSERDVLACEIDGEKIAVFPTGRGGEVTYHGPGQLVCYVIADLRRRQDLHKHVWRLEEMVIRTLADFAIEGERSERGIGVWVEGKKIAAVGVRCRKWITYHGIALNINPNLKHFSGIVACGMADSPVTSMWQLGAEVSREAVEQHIRRHSSIFS